MINMKALAGALPSALATVLIERTAPGSIAARLSKAALDYPNWLASVRRNFLVPTRYGFSIWCDRAEHIGQHLIRDGQWEGLLSRTILACLEPGQVCIDIGANIGYDSMLMSRAVGTSGRVLAFEPDLKNLRSLLINLDLLPESNVITFGVALGDDWSSANIALANDLNRGQSNLRPDARGAYQPILIARLDDLVPANVFPSISLVKIDVEGFEYKVIRGMDRVIQRVNTVICEVVPSYLKQCGASAEMLFAKMNQSGFTSFCAPPGCDKRWIPSGSRFPIAGQQAGQFDALFVRRMTPALESLVQV